MAHLEIVRGDSVEYTVRLTGPGGTALDLTDAALFWTMKADASDEDVDAVAMADWEDGGGSSGISVNDPESGIVTLTVAAADTADWDPEVYVYDLQLVTVTGRVRTVDEGRVTVRADVTRRTAVAP